MIENPVIKKRYWRLQAFMTGLLKGDRSWGSVRLLITLIIALIFMIIASFLYEASATQAMVENWRVSFPLLDLVPDVFLRFLASFFSLRCLRYLLVPLAGVSGTMLAGARYIQDIYNLNSFKLAFSYLAASLFGIGYPHLTISNGKKEIKPGEYNLLDIIGGPGYIHIQPGNVVVFERLRSPSNVRSAGVHFVSRLETLKEIANLNDQHGFIDTVPATSKDGIEINVREVHFRYRLRTGRRPGDYAGRTPADPYPYSIEAVRNMAYQRTVRPNGVTGWDDAVSSVIRGVIADYISQHQFDYLTAPRYQETDPRAEIRRQINSRRVRDRLRNLGAELLWFDIGHFEVSDKAVDAQRLDTWQAKWIGNASVERAYGDAQRLAYQELGRAEAQAEMLMSIVHALEDLGLSDDPTQNLRKIVLARTAHILEAMTDRQQLPDQEAGSHG